MEQKEADTARNQLDEAADHQLQKAADKYKEHVLMPLEKLDLEPTPLDLMTTSDRLVMRLRLAANDQLGAHTPRPRAPSDSAISVQMHESALNNILDQLQLDGKTFTLPELYQYVCESLSIDGTPPEDLSRRAKITFAPRDATRGRCEEGQIELTLSIAEIREGRNSWRNFQVRVFYRPEVNLLHTELVRDGSIQLISEHLRGKLALRIIFSKLFSQNRRPQLVRDSLAQDPRFRKMQVTQFTLDDGWLGFAMGPILEQVERQIPHRKL